MDETENNSGFAAGSLALQATPELSDNELVASIIAGDEAAFEVVFNRYRLQVGRVASRFFQRREQIEEIVQESFTKAYFALPDYVGKGEKSFIAWLTRITVNTCYDELRRAKRQPQTMHSDLNEAEAAWLDARLRAGESGSNLESEMVTRDLADKLLARLEPEDRMVLTLLNGEELSAAEIADATGWSVAKVKVRAHRARLALRKVLRKLL
jgi:RNA polymerase sigma-70 factor (ECF subfamily)